MKAYFERYIFKFVAEKLSIEKSGGELGMRPIMWPVWVGNLVLFVTTCDVCFPLADRQGLQFSVILSFYAPGYVETGLGKIL